MERVFELTEIADVPPLVSTTRNGNRHPGLVGSGRANLNNTVIGSASASRPLKRASDICDTSIASRSYICKSLASKDGEANETLAVEDDEDDSYLKNENLESLFSGNSSMISKRFRKE